jgi:hypothetical protein
LAIGTHVGSAVDGVTVVGGAVVVKLELGGTEIDGFGGVRGLIPSVPLLPSQPVTKKARTINPLDRKGLEASGLI